MKTTLMQIDLVWGDPDANRRRNDERLKTVGDTDLVVFPEMFSTGFVTRPAGIAEKDGATLDWMKTRAREYGFAIAGSIATEEGGKFYNRFHFVEPTGKVTSYDKRHLFSYSGEDLTFTPGDRRVVLEYAGIRILPQICYDLRFPETGRNRLLPSGVPDYDLALYVASWPVKRVDAWSALLKARAIENQCFLIGVNRVGTDPFCTYTGASVALDPFGKTLVACLPGKEEVVQAEIDLDSFAAYRASFPVLKDIIAP